MIASHMSFLAENSAAIKALFEEGRALAQLYGQDKVYDFSLGNPSTPPPDKIREEAVRILQETDPLFLHGYMSNAGYEDVREEVAASLNRRFEVSFTKQNLMMTVGAAGALVIALKVILEKGDEVLLQAPYFIDYSNYIQNFDGVPVVLSPHYEDFSFNFQELETKISSKTKAIIVNSPNNPTGVIYPEKDIRRLTDFLSQKEKEYGHAIYLISDEPYRELVFTGEEVPYLPKYYDNTFVAYSFSKSLSLPGERIGYLVINTAMEEFEKTVEAAMAASRVLGFVNAPSLWQRVIKACVQDTGDLTVYRRNRELLLKELTKMGYDIIAPQGTFYMFPKSPTKDEKEFIQAAKEERILLVPGSSFACPGYFRLAFCVSEATCEGALEGFRRLARRFNLS